jgi:large subunit ribosomal protein L22
VNSKNRGFFDSQQRSTINKNMEAIAKTKYLKGSPRKARLVIDLIRGHNVSKALAILKFTDKRAAQPIAKCLNSAIANATYLAEQQNIAIDPDDLWINLCFVDMGPTKGRRRMRPAPQGRAYREQRHYCHITIQVSSDVQAKDEEAAKKAAAAAERRAKMGDTKAPAEAAKKAEVSAKKAKKAEYAEETKKAVADEAPVDDEVTPVVETAAAETAPVEVQAETPEAPETPVREAEAAEAAEPVVEEAPDETPAEEVEAQEVVEEAPAEAPAEAVEAQEAVEAEQVKDDADVSAAKEAESHTEAEENETKPADEAQLDKNEDLERQ